MDTTRGFSRRESARTRASGTKRFSLRRLEAAEDDVERLRCETRGNEDVYEKACEKRHAHDAEDCFFDVQRTQHQARRHDSGFRREV